MKPLVVSSVIVPPGAVGIVRYPGDEIPPRHEAWSIQVVEGAVELAVAAAHGVSLG